VENKTGSTQDEIISDSLDVRLKHGLKTIDLMETMFAIPENQFEKSLQQMQQSAQKQAAQISSAVFEDFRRTMKSVSEKMRENFRNLPSQLKENLILLGNHGWYLDDDMDIPWLTRLGGMLNDGNISEAEKVLVKHFERRLDAIEESLVASYPDRAVIIRSAFKAHRRQEYELSIPVLFAQADGVCSDLTRKLLFEKENKKPKVVPFIDQTTTSELMASILSPLRESLPIYQSRNERCEGFTGLNRHMVLHGESLDYANKVNGLKAISLINYIAQSLQGLASD